MNAKANGMNDTLPMESLPGELEDNGFTIVPGAFPDVEADALATELQQALAAPSAATAIRSSRDAVYAARNVLEFFPKAARVWRRPPLPELLERILGPHFGLVRGLFFDKPPEQTWALPWHKDLTIAVREHRQPLGAFQKPTRKAGVPHVEAPRELLEAMLTMRIHLDDVTEMNGPMRVIPGSHLTGKTMAIDETQRCSILVRKGDVLLIRPLVAHASAASHPDNTEHRRILHLEFAGWSELPDGYAWHTFIPGNVSQD
jgi:Phytanoyl-CoA dioxygenase (PhyH)